MVLQLIQPVDNEFQLSITLLQKAYFLISSLKFLLKISGHVLFYHLLQTEKKINLTLFAHCGISGGGAVVTGGVVVSIAAFDPRGRVFDAYSLLCFFKPGEPRVTCTL